MAEIYFHGAWSPRHLGHFLYRPDGRTVWSEDRLLPSAWVGRLDGGLCPRDEAQTEGRAALLRKDGWTAIAFWDRTADRRMNSNSVFLMRGELSFDEMVTAARGAFPSIWARFPFVPAPPHPQTERSGR